MRLRWQSLRGSEPLRPRWTCGEGEKTCLRDEWDSSSFRDLTADVETSSGARGHVGGRQVAGIWPVRKKRWIVGRRVEYRR